MAMKGVNQNNDDYDGEGEGNGEEGDKQDILRNRHKCDENREKGWRKEKLLFTLWGRQEEEAESLCAAAAAAAAAAAFRLQHAPYYIYI